MVVTVWLVQGIACMLVLLFLGASILVMPILWLTLVLPLVLLLEMLGLFGALFRLLGWVK